MPKLHTPVEMLKYATQFRLPLTNTLGGYGEVTIQRGEGQHRERWAVTDGSLHRLQIWTEHDGWRYITDIGATAAYRHTLDQAFEVAQRVVEIESACLEAEINAISHPAPERPCRHQP